MKGKTSPEGSKRSSSQTRRGSNPKSETKEKMPVLQRLKTSSSIILKSHSRSDINDCQSKDKGGGRRCCGCKDPPINNEVKSSFNDFAGLGGTCDDYTGEDQQQRKPSWTQSALNLNTKQRDTNSGTLTSRRHLSKQKVNRLKLYTQGASDNSIQTSSCPHLSAIDRNSGCMTSRDSFANAETCNKKETGGLSTRLLKNLTNGAVSSRISTPETARKKAAWAGDNNPLLKGAISSSPMSTPTLRRKRINIDFTPKFLSNPSSRQSSANSFNSKDIKIIVFSNNTDNRTSPNRKQSVMESNISKNEKIIDIMDNVDTSVSIKTTGNNRTTVNDTMIDNTCDNQVESTVTKNIINDSNDKEHCSMPHQESKHLPPSFPDIQNLDPVDRYFNEDLTHDVYMKCLKWLQGLQAAQEENKCLEVVTLPPIEWND